METQKPVKKSCELKCILFVIIFFAIATANQSLAFHFEDYTAPVLIDENTDCSSLNVIDAGWYLSEMLTFNPYSLIPEVAALYEDDSGGIYVNLTKVVAGTTNAECNWNFNFLFTISDAAGNATTCEVYYSGGDHFPPNLIDETISCTTLNQSSLDLCDGGFDPATLIPDVAALYEDNCDENFTVTLTGVAVSAGYSNNEQAWSYDFTYTIKDKCNNFTTCMVTVSGGDQSAPHLKNEAVTCATLNQSGLDLCDGGFDPATLIPDVAALYEDNCDQNFTVTLSGVAASPGYSNNEEAWSYDFTYTIKDKCNNFTTCTITVSGGDQSAPHLKNEAVTCASLNQNDLDLCDGGFDPATLIPDVAALYEDNCDENFTVTLTGVAASAGYSNNEQAWSYDFTYTIKDKCNNFTTCMVTVSGGDQSAPHLKNEVVTCTSLNQNDLDLCDGGFDPATLIPDVAALYEDNCDENFTTYLSSVAASAGYSNYDCAWSYDFTFTIHDKCLNYTTCRITVNGGLKTPAPILTKNITLPIGDNGTLLLADNAVDNGTSGRCGSNVTFSLDKKEFTCNDRGENEVTMTVTDKCGNQATGTATVTITVPTVTDLLVNAESAHYMDEVTLVAEVESFCGNNELQGNVEFFLDDIPVGSAPALPVPEEETGFPGKLRATLLYKIGLDENQQLNELLFPKNNPETPWTLKARFIPSTDFFEASEDETGLLISPRAIYPFNTQSGFYTGTIIAWTTGSNSGTGKVTLAAMLHDQNLPYGDVRGAKVTFCYVNGSSLTPISGAANLPVNLISQTDQTVGAAGTVVQLDISKADAGSFLIAVMVTGAYRNNPYSEEAQALITVARPVTGGAIVGGGTLVNSGSEGQIKGAVGKSTGFEFDVKYNKKKTNALGKMTLQIRSWNKPDGTPDQTLHNYIVTSNAINLMVIGPNEALAGNQAVFDAKANLAEMLEDGTIKGIEGNSQLLVTMTDGGKNPEDNRIKITYYKSSGGIWFSSNISLEQALATGDIVVAGDGSKEEDSEPKPGKKSTTEAAIAGPKVQQSLFQVYPNPFSGELHFEFVAETASHTRIDLYDVTGRLVKTIFNQPVKEGVLYRAEFKPEGPAGRFYIYRMTSGDAVRTGRVIHTE